MRIWIDDIRPMLEEFDKHFKTVDDAIAFLDDYALSGERVELISLDHDAGAQAKYGGDYIKILDYLEYLKKEYGLEVCTRFRIHTGNPYGAERMRQIIKRCGWEECVFDWEEMF